MANETGPTSGRSLLTRGFARAIDRTLINAGAAHGFASRVSRPSALPGRLDVKKNIETHFMAKTISPPLEELRLLTVNVSTALIKDQFSACSVIVRRAA